MPVRKKRGLHHATLRVKKLRDKLVVNFEISNKLLSVFNNIGWGLIIILSQIFVK
jgi:hypothetical protein